MMLAKQLQTLDAGGVLFVLTSLQKQGALDGYSTHRTNDRQGLELAMPEMWRRYARSLWLSVDCIFNPESARAERDFRR